ncbi:uncharacterized protein CTRU02_209492 [Colletotrichum truncatum]|uniref:Integral membrane protein n=1 Tax=Colletotrichum truncatum TaxID=5467 RepID=A0ACC3YSP5_COLTU|nr:uncharacterized protein CTRU02_08430 [Colletotrichum truncatum]KAF6789731.1 integral membrane protein [Colletotrichum truncatum]
MSEPSPLVVLGGNFAGMFVFGLILSHFFGRKSALTILANIFGTIFIVFGVNAILRPQNALSFFQWSYPVDPTSRELLDRVMIIYGARDIFMGIALYSAAIFGSRKALGSILIAASATAGVDGLVCKMSEGGEWQHWGYASVLTVVGALLMR